MNNKPKKVQPSPDIAQSFTGEAWVTLAPRMKPKGLFEKDTTLAALKQAFVMLRPDTQWKNPVMFVVEVGAFLTLLYIIAGGLGQRSERGAHQLFHLGGRLALLDRAVRQLRHGPGRSPGKGPGRFASAGPSRNRGLSS